jgi:DNA-binding NtrC family response regulator
MSAGGDTGGWSWAPMAGADLPSFHGIIGRSAAMQRLFRWIERVARADVPVLIQGESGTGKELVVQAIQRLSRRSNRPLRTINYGSLARELLLSELFGHERGAFTGAVIRKIGLAAEADGGTLFLDEVAELLPDAQVALLRFLQEGEIRPVGSAETSRVDVRVVAGTHRTLSGMVAAGTFRADLYYRLRWMTVAIPPLRDRPDDIPLLADHIRIQLNPLVDAAVTGFSPRAMARLQDGAWPGYVRELETTVAQALAVRGEGQVQLEDLEQLSEMDATPVVPEPTALQAAFERDDALEWPQQEALRIAAARGEVRRSDLITRCGISTESARKYFVGLVERKLLRRVGSGGRGVRYVLVRRRVDNSRAPRGHHGDRNRNARDGKRKEAQRGRKR